MKNAKVHSVTYQQALGNAAFSAGFKDVAQSNGWNERLELAEQWNYERGRMFAAWLATKGMNPATFPLKSGRWASKIAIDYFKLASSESAVF